MNYKQIIQAVVAAMLIVITLSACVRPASTPPEGSADTTTTADFPVPGTADDVMSQLESLATQTAIAMQGGTPQVQPTAMVATQIAPTAAVIDVTQPTALPASPEPTQQQVVVPTATPGLPATWTLQTGEFPYCIARRYNVNPNEMLELSGLSAGSTYTAGTVLKIPKTGNTFPGLVLCANTRIPTALNPVIQSTQSLVSTGMLIPMPSSLPTACNPPIILKRVKRFRSPDRTFIT